MKLYTKEMFLIAAEKCEVSMIDAQHIMKYIDEYVSPIYLPTDEEIKEKLNVAYSNGYEQGEMVFYKKMQVKGDKYAEGYTEGYKRALELIKWKIDNEIQGGNK